MYTRIYAYMHICTYAYMQRGLAKYCGLFACVCIYVYIYTYCITATNNSIISFTLKHINIEISDRLQFMSSVVISRFVFSNV